MPKKSSAHKWSVITANVNGVRAALRRGGLDWLAAAKVDAICLQEVRATHEQLHEALAESPLAGYHVAHAPAPELGRAGVAVLTREQPSAVRDDVKGLGGQGRWIEVDLDTAVGPLTVVSTYVHSGELDSPKQVAKYAFLEQMTKRLEVLRKSAQKSWEISTSPITRWTSRTGRAIEARLVSSRTSALIWTFGLPSTGPILVVTTGERVRGPTRGGRGVGRRSTQTVAGASTMPSPRAVSLSGVRESRSVARPVTTSAGATTRR